MDTSSNLRTVRGAVVIRENGIGVPDLLIVVGLQTKESAISLGSCITDADGRYVLDYSHTTNLELAAWLRTLSAEIPDMLVVVNRDDPGSSGLATIASEIRRAPGISEVMSFRIAQADLDQAQVVLQDSPEAKDQLAARNAIYEVRTTDSMETERESNRLSFVRRMQEAKKGKQGTAEIRRALSVNSDDARYVHSESEREEKIEAAVRSSVKGRINPSRVTGRLSTEAAGEVGPDGLIDAGRVEVATSHRMPSGLIMRHKMPCVPRMPYDSCLAALYPTPPEPPVEPEEPPPGDVADPAPLLEEDISKAARRVLGGLLGDENITGKTRAGLAEVERSVEGFVLHSGPADTSSIHDFQQIQMAFEHVWEELLDEDLVSVGEDLYGQLVTAGLPPGDHLFDGEGDISSSSSTTTITYSPPAYVQQAFDISFKEWTKIKQWKLNQELIYLAERACYTWWEKTKGFMPAITAGHQREALKEGNRLIDNIRKRLVVKEVDEFDAYHENLKAMRKRMKEPYRFTIYAASRKYRSVNFGVVTTYRQYWEPVAYQVGELVKTIPLAPSEKRRFTKKVHVKTTRVEKELNKNSSTASDSSMEKSRAETKIVSEARKEMNNHEKVNGSVNFGFGSARAEAYFSNKGAEKSAETKKQFREAVIKSAHKYKSERSTEVSVEGTETYDYEESGEISNPNEEITVTYLFYELQRRYKIREEIHSVRPVIFVAQEFPKPNEIDEDWVLAHDWILRRVILDDSFLPAMTYIASDVVGDEFSLREMLKNLEQQRAVMEETKASVVELHEQVQSRYIALSRAISRTASAVGEEDSQGLFEDIGEFFHGDVGASPESMKIMEGAAQDAHNRAAQAEKEMQTKLERETSSLNAITEAYTNKLSKHLNQKNLILRLLFHFKSNIMYYMQAIWTHEPSDQRFFRLHKVKVPDLKGKMTYKTVPDPDGIPMPPTWKKPLKIEASCDLDVDNISYKHLEEVADIDQLLGFRGNYMMFPLLEENVLTKYMTFPYYNEAIGLQDPDPLATWSLETFTRYVCCLREKLTQAQFDKIRPGLLEAYEHILENLSTDEIIVSTGSLYIEALPGSHPLLEDFKLLHRGVDVQKAFSEVRESELENVRLAARLVTADYDDPDVDKKIVIEGAPHVDVEV